LASSKALDTAAGKAFPTIVTGKAGPRAVRGSQQPPAIMHDFLVSFITRHKDPPFFVYYPMSHIHRPIVQRKQV
jgi:hypothetical protein